LLERLSGGDAVLRLASLLPANPDVADTVAKRLKLSKAINKRLVLAAGRTASDAAHPRRLAYKLGMEAAQDRLNLLCEPGALASLEGWQPPRFPLSGGALVARGIKEGPDVARILKEIEERWISEGFPDSDRVQQMTNDLA
jgi:poly(A) polymerase